MLFIITGLQLQTTETDKNVPFIPEFVYLLPVSNKYGFTVVGCPSGKANYLVQKKLFGGCINALNRHETLETIATLDTLFSWSLDVVLPQIECRMTSAHAAWMWEGCILICHGQKWTCPYLHRPLSFVSVVLHLMEEYKDQGYVVYLDKYYSSPVLFNYLFQNRISAYMWDSACKPERFAQMRAAGNRVGSGHRACSISEG